MPKRLSKRRVRRSARKGRGGGGGRSVKRRVVSRGGMDKAAADENKTMTRFEQVVTRLPTGGHHPHSYPKGRDWYY